MTRITCPACQEGQLAWDARSQVFLCLSHTCTAFFKPTVEGMNDREVGVLISRGQMKVDPGWFAARDAAAQADNRVFLRM